MIIAGPLKIVVATAAIAVAPFFGVIVKPLSRPEAPPAIASPELVALKAGSFRYASGGEFLRDGKPVDAPVSTMRRTRPLLIMKYQVTQQDYHRCAGDGACPPLPSSSATDGNTPAVMLSWRDASAYADWLSQKLRVRYRLPTDEEWTVAAASRAPNEAPLMRNSGDPIARWLARYEQESAAKPVNATPMPAGTFGINENGLADLAGNVWEWTTTCYTRSVITDGEAHIVTTNCGVRAAEGRHRAFVTDFIRDARGGGCASGVPPSNLGLRLVRETGRPWNLIARFAAIVVTLSNNPIHRP